VRLIPERTVDAMFAVEVAHYLPTSIFWSPTPTAGELDHGFLTSGMQAMIFECKAVVTDKMRDPRKEWRSEINVAQLRSYLDSELPILYVLPVKPDDLDKPWVRSSEGERCSYCRYPDARRSADRSPAVISADLRARSQPWFAHWCWVIPAVGLSSYRKGGSQVTISASSTNFEKIAGAERLCSFLAGIQTDRPDLNRHFIDQQKWSQWAQQIAVSSESMGLADSRKRGNLANLLFMLLPGEERALNAARHADFGRIDDHGTRGKI